MKKTPLLVCAYAILLLFLIQSAGTLVESIYILDLLNTRLDEKALGLLFFFTPLLALPFFKRFPRGLAWLLAAALIAARGLTPYLGTPGRLVSAGIATGAALSLLLLLLSARTEEDRGAAAGPAAAAGLALAVGLSTLLRTINAGVEYSLTPAGGSLSWLLGALFGWLVLQVEFAPASAPAPARKPVTKPLLGVFLIITLVYFVFSAPAVIVRWTESSYPLVVSAVSLLSLAAAWLFLFRPDLPDRLTPAALLAWNALFTLSLTGTLLAHRVALPPTLDSPPVVVGAPSLLQQVPLVLMLLLFPVLFVDMRRLFGQLAASAPTPASLVPGFLLGTFALILLVFMHIFTNVWAYVEPVSPLFRNLLWLPHLLLAGGISLAAWGLPGLPAAPTPAPARAWTIGLAGLFLLTAAAPLSGPRILEIAGEKTSLVIMTYNTQQFNTADGEKSADAQLALVRRADPDILVLQESDATRISFNNNDYVRYFAEKLGYHAYYGPTPVSGTFGTAILSKYPLENTRSVFVYSDADEMGVAEAEVVIAGMRFFIYNVHPAASDPAMVNFAHTVLARARDKDPVIIAGDFNLRDTEEAYKLFNQKLTNAWTSVYPTKISPDGVDMSGRNRIDHIFFSPGLQAVNPVYVLPPESATDHPVHWTEITWKP